MPGGTLRLEPPLPPTPVPSLLPSGRRLSAHKVDPVRVLRFQRLQGEAGLSKQSQSLLSQRSRTPKHPNSDLCLQNILQVHSTWCLSHLLLGRSPFYLEYTGGHGLGVRQPWVCAPGLALTSCVTVGK